MEKEINGKCTGKQEDFDPLLNRIMRLVPFPIKIPIIANDLKVGDVKIDFIKNRQTPGTLNTKRTAAASVWEIGCSIIAYEDFVNLGIKKIIET